MFVVGLTGGIATGKSTVSDMLMQLGCKVIDADIIAREVVEPGKPAWKQIKANFGEEYFFANGMLNREKLGKLIFANERNRRTLNSITHPEIFKTILKRLFQLFLRGEQFVILDSPLLYETKKMLPFLSYIIVVSCNNRINLLRLQSRNNLTEEEATQRINSQLPLAEKCRQASFVIDNSGSLEDTKVQVVHVHQQLKHSVKHWKIRMILIGVLSVFGFSMYRVYQFFKS